MTEKYSIAVVAHSSRAKYVHELVEQIEPESVVWDGTDQGCAATHLLAWEWLADSPGDWKVVLEDDAVPVEGFDDQLAQVLHVAPADVVSLYLGRFSPPHWQSSIARSFRPHNADPHFLVCGYLLHGVGYAIRAERVTDMVKYLRLKLGREPGLPFDEAISKWVCRRRQRVAYCRPSLVDHRDGPPVIVARADGRFLPEPPRTAWCCDTREYWLPTAAKIPLPEQLGGKKFGPACSI